MSRYVQSITVATDSPETYNQAANVLNKVMDHLHPGIGMVSYSSATVEEENAGLDGYKLFDVVDVITGVMGCDMYKARDLIRALQSHNFYVECRG